MKTRSQKGEEMRKFTQKIGRLSDGEPLSWKALSSRIPLESLLMCQPKVAIKVESQSASRCFEKPASSEEPKPERRLRGTHESSSIAEQMLFEANASKEQLASNVLQAVFFPKKTPEKIKYSSPIDRQIELLSG